MFLPAHWRLTIHDNAELRRRTICQWLFWIDRAYLLVEEEDLSGLANCSELAIKGTVDDKRAEQRKWN